jgi:metal-dependent amidase/aminoacylase/carboxypeptidase family protein
LEGIERIAQGIATAHGATAEVVIGRDGLASIPVTINDSAVARHVQRLATELFGSAHVLDLAAPIMASEDFSFMLQRVPGAMTFLGTRPAGVDRPEPLHSARMMLDERQLATGATLHAAFALSVLSG